jgi:hypothetical protein
VRELFDAIESAPPVVILAALVAVLALVVAIEHALQWLRWIRAHEYLQGYAIGYDDGSLDKIRAFSGDVPTRESR